MSAGLGTHKSENAPASPKAIEACAILDRPPKSDRADVATPTVPE